MEIKQIIVLKESRPGEARVALTPDAVALLTTQKGVPVWVENGAGELAQFSDQEYVHAGAHLFTFGEKLPAHSFILRVKCPIKTRETLENTFLSTETVMMGFLDPLMEDTSHITRWKALGLSLIPLEVLPLSADDPKNAQAAMSHIAGRLALQDALSCYQGRDPKKVTVIGTGPAGLAAAFRARELGLLVQLFGRREQFRALVEAKGIEYFILPQHEPREFLRQYLRDQTILLTAARPVGQKAPIFIAEPEFELLPDDSVIVDLAVSEGGNVKGSKSDRVVTIERNISIVNISGYPKAEPRIASKAFSDCMVNLLLEIITADKKLDSNHPLIKGYADIS